MNKLELSKKYNFDLGEITFPDESTSSFEDLINQGDEHLKKNYLEDREEKCQKKKEKIISAEIKKPLMEVQSGTIMSDSFTTIFKKSERKTRRYQNNNIPNSVKQQGTNNTRYTNNGYQASEMKRVSNFGGSQMRYNINPDKRSKLSGLTVKEKEITGTKSNYVDGKFQKFMLDLSKKTY